MGGVAGAIATGVGGAALIGAGFATGNPGLILAGSSAVLGAASQAIAGKPPGLGAGAGARGSLASFSPTVPPERIILGYMGVPGSPLTGHEHAERVKDNPDREFATIIYLLTRRVPLTKFYGLVVNGTFVEMLPTGGTDWFPDDQFVPRKADTRHKELIGVHFEPGDGSAGPFDYFYGDRSKGEWNSSTKLTNIAYAGVTWKFDPERMPEVPQDVLFVVDGFKCFDPRSGTEVFGYNPALHWRWLLTGPYGPDGGIDPALIDDASVIAAANICEEKLTLKSGQQVDRYQCSGVWDATRNVYDIEKEILDCCAGRVVRVGAKYKIVVGAARPVALKLSHHDLAGPITRLSAKLPRREAKNSAKALYRDWKNNWVDKETKPYAPSSFLAQDNGRKRVLELALPAVDTAQQAERLQKIALETLRQQITMSATFKPRAMQLEGLDVIEYTDPQLGMVDFQFEIERSDIDIEAGTVAFELREYGDQRYTWDPNEEAEIPAEDPGQYQLSAVEPICLNVPVCRYEHTRPEDWGFYAGFRATEAGKLVRPARLWRRDKLTGRPYVIAYPQRPLIMGNCTHTLRTAGVRAGVIDRGYTLEVVLDRDVVLSSTDEYGIANMANLALIGRLTSQQNMEWLQFMTAVRVPGEDRTWLLSDFRRGLFGTTDEMPLRTSGEVLIVHDPALIRIADPPSLLRQTRWYEVTYDGEEPDPDTVPLAFTNAGEGIRPIPPDRAWMAREEATGDLILGWTVRSRGYVGWVDGAGDPDADPERYRVQIFASAVAATPLRTAYFDGGPSWRYTAALQAQDFGGEAPVPLYAGISKRKRDYGSGDEARFALDVAEVI